MKSLSELGIELPRCRPIAQVGDIESIISASKPDFFVEPPLSFHPDFEEVPNPEVVLISAAGAVGKSTLAAAISHQFDAPLWKLERNVILGAGTYVGQTVNCFGIQGLTEIEDAAAAGEFFQVMDSLDEAMIRSGGFEHLEAFLGDIADHLMRLRNIAGYDGNSVRIVILGRMPTIGTAWLVLEDLGIRTQCLQVDYFGYSAATEFIEGYLKHSHNEALIRPSRTAPIDTTSDEFRRSRDAIMSGIAGLVGRDRSVGGATQNDEPNRLASSFETNPVTKSFLGYAPVLQSIARLLDDGDLLERLSAADYSLSKVFIANDDETSLWGLVRQIATRIIDRDVDKLNAQLAEIIPVETPWAYSADDSLEHLLQIDGVARDVQLPNGIPPLVHERVFNSIRDFLQQHPFLAPGGETKPLPHRFANAVFTEFMLARALCSSNQILRQNCLVQFRPPLYRPTALLSRFVLTDDGNGALDGEILPILTRSLAADRELGNTPQVSITELPCEGGHEHDGGQGGQPIRVQVGLFEYMGDGDAEVPLMSCELSIDTGEQLRIAGDLCNLVVDVPNVIVHWDDGGSAVVTDAIAIHCQELWVNLKSLKMVNGPAFTGSDEDGGSLQVNARRVVEYCEANMPDAQNDDVVINADTADYPWERFRVGGYVERKEDQFDVAARELRSIWKWFHAIGRQRGGHREVPRGVTDTALNKGILHQEMLDYCLNSDPPLIYAYADGYSLDLASHGIDVGSLKLLYRTDPLVGFLLNYRSS